ncbi:MAG: DUF2442 domain-containing protein [Chloroflexi bacterium]|nr:DUF2442 domain-containing protein [Chloroflexota bacterium]
MHHEIHTVSEFKIIAPFTLRIRFDDGHVQVIDFWPILRGEMFGPLRDLDLFNGVTLDEEASTLVWPNGADFDPATLHDWDRVGAAMIRMAQTWQESPASDRWVEAVAVR